MTFSIMLITLMFSCCGQTDNKTDKVSKDLNPKTSNFGYLNSLISLTVPYEKNPKTPSKEYLESLDLVPFEALTIDKIKTKSGQRIRNYKKDSQLFNGWTIQKFNKNEHRFRYTHYTMGFADWQIGYFDNDELDHDFHMKDGVNCGSARMWQKGGCLYIDTYFLEGGIGDGPAYAWYENCRLSRDALLDNGRILYEVKFDHEGNIIEKQGEVPEKYK